MVQMTEGRKILPKKNKVFAVYKQRCVAVTGIVDSEIIYLYAATLKKLSEYLLPVVKDEFDGGAEFRKGTPEKIAIIDIGIMGECDYREVLYATFFSKINIMETDLSFLKGKYSEEAFKITMILIKNRLYFLGKKLDPKYIKTKWS